MYRTFRLMWVVLLVWTQFCLATQLRIPESTDNLLKQAKISGNLPSFQKGLRGAPDHVVYDMQQRKFTVPSPHHEYGVGFGEDLGVVPEDEAAWWMAQWPRPVQVNMMVFSGVFSNQPQPETAWKIEYRSAGQWITHERGKGAWYDGGQYVWGGPGTKLIAMEALRVSVFSSDDKTPLKSIHFRGEENASWVVAKCPMVDARMQLPLRTVRVGSPVSFAAEPLKGRINAWTWDFGDGVTSSGANVTHVYDRIGTFQIKLSFSDGKDQGTVQESLKVMPPIEARITPLTSAVLTGEAVSFRGHQSLGSIDQYDWDFGDGKQAQGRRARHRFKRPGIYRVTLTVSDQAYKDQCLALVRVHTPETLHVPQVVLDTDQKNEQDDQYYFGYGLFSELDILAVNSIHHGGGQEPVNYEEILKILDLARKSGLPDHRVPMVFRGADQRLTVPASGQWHHTQPIATDASEAILAAARGASPDNPVWIVPVGPGTNTASAILQAREQGLDLKGRMRICWLGGSNNEITHEFNGNNDPWSMYVVAQGPVETWIMPAPVGARVRIDKRTEPHYYADNPLGEYLKEITPAHNKPLFDPSCLSAVISWRLGLDWVKESEPVTIAGPEQGYRWTRTNKTTNVRVIRQIDQQAMKDDIFNTLKNKKQRLIGVPQ